MNLRDSWGYLLFMLAVAVIIAGAFIVATSK